jgi:hypothetical protein
MYIYRERDRVYHPSPRSTVYYTVWAKVRCKYVVYQEKIWKMEDKRFFLLSGLYCEGLVCKKITNNICFFPKWTLWFSQNEDFYVDSKHINLPYP